MAENGAQPPPSEGTIENLLRDSQGASAQDASSIRRDLREALSKTMDPPANGAEAQANGAPEPTTPPPAPTSESAIPPESDGGGGSMVQLGELAQAWGQPIETLYDRVEIPLRDGMEPVSLGTLKDSYQEKTQLDTREAALIERTQQLETRVAQETRVARELIAAVGASPEQIERARQLADQRASEEVQTLLSLVPDWQDQNVLQTDISALEKRVSRFGLGSGNIYEAMSGDHRWALVLRDYLALSKRIDLAEKNAKREQKPVSEKQPPQAATGGGDKKWLHRPERIQTDRDRIAELFNR